MPAEAVQERRFAYNKDQCKRIYDYLDSNWNETTSVFSCVWNDGTFKGQEDKADMILELIDKVYFYRKTEGRNFERVWTAMHTYVNLVSPEEIVTPESLCQNQP